MRERFGTSGVVILSVFRALRAHQEITRDSPAAYCSASRNRRESAAQKKRQRYDPTAGATALGEESLEGEARFVNTEFAFGFATKKRR